MSSIDTRPSFFPNSRTNRRNAVQSPTKALQRNSQTRIDELNNMSSKDAKVNINNAIKDFSRIKKAVDMAPEVDNSDKIAQLKAQINNGTYKVDYEALADKMLASEF